MEITPSKPQEDKCAVCGKAVRLDPVHILSFDLACCQDCKGRLKRVIKNLLNGLRQSNGLDPMAEEKSIWK